MRFRSFGKSPFLSLFVRIRIVEALWDHVTDDPEELPFEAEERLVVVDATDANWWYATYLEQVNPLIILWLA